MSAIHGIASAVVPGLGQLIGGEAKEGVKHAAVAYVGAPVVAGAGAMLTAIGCDGFYSSASKTASENLPKVLNVLKSHPKLTAAVGLTCAVGAAIWSGVNYIKSIVNAAKIDKKQD
ncbi:MAG: hypothetical protein IJB79_07805 [Candidatus Gastranaerophilales bacterium]|nr:hypothetical protein [Candidatus Gastranaerophilales bacterium]